MTWFAFHGSYSDIDAAGAEEKLLVSLGFHGYATQAEADANRNSVNFLQAIELRSLEASHIVNPTSGGAIPQAASAATGSVTGFLGKLSQRNLWLRVLKILAGLALIVTGIVQLTRTQNLIKTAAKGAVTA